MGGGWGWGGAGGGYCLLYVTYHSGCVVSYCPVALYVT